MSYNVVGVRFKQAGKIYYFDPAGIEVNQGDFVIVETARGLEHGQVMVGPREVSEDKVTLPLKNVLRVATPEDNIQLAENKEKEKKALNICEEKVNHHKLEMKLVDVEYTFDRSKIIFYFTADGRVDFRELVKDLAAVFRTRIELRQIGVRDEAKMLGGLGPCGRPLCCATFLGDFEPVSIKMAKEQNLSLNPVKISGICSRLMCCLKYESSAYRDAKSVDLPLIGSKIVYDGREGKILANNQMKETVFVEFLNGDKKEISLSAIEEIILDEKPKAPQEVKEPAKEAKPGKEPRQQGDVGENKAPREPRETRDPRAARESKATRESGEPREPKDFKEARAPREFKQPREPKEFKQSRESKDNKEPREPKEAREPKESKPSREPREFKRPKETKDFKSPQEPKEFKQPREARDFKQPREPREFKKPREPRDFKPAKGPREFKQPNEREPQEPRDKPTE